MIYFWLDMFAISFNMKYCIERVELGILLEDFTMFMILVKSKRTQQTLF